MPILNGYCTLDDLKAALGIPAIDTASDTGIEAAIEAASRWIEGWCRTRFYTTTANEVRVFTAGRYCHVLTDDIISVATVSTDDNADRTYSTIWAATDYELEPANAALDGKPYRAIHMTPNGNYSFPLGRNAVKVTGKFGYAAAAPAHVQQACIRRAAQLFRTTGATGGSLGSGEYGTMQALPAPDSMVLFLLSEIANERISVG